MAFAYRKGWLERHHVRAFSATQSCHGRQGAPSNGFAPVFDTMCLECLTLLQVKRVVYSTPIHYETVYIRINFFCM